MEAVTLAKESRYISDQRAIKPHSHSINDPGAAIDAVGTGEPVMTEQVRVVEFEHGTFLVGYDAGVAAVRRQYTGYDRLDQLRQFTGLAHEGKAGVNCQLRENATS